MIPKRSLGKLAATLGGMPVLSTLPSSPAARAGIRYGDIVLSVNGRPTPTVDDYVQATMIRRDGMTLVLFRDGVEHELELLYDRDARAERDLASVVKEIVERRVLSEYPEPPDDDGSDGDA